MDRAIRVQYGVLPYRFTETNSLEVLLVTTRQTRRWIVPKGWPIKGLKSPPRPKPMKKRNVSMTLRQSAFEFKLGFLAFGLAG
jgi:hypothetical protein